MKTLTGLCVLLTFVCVACGQSTAEIQTQAASSVFATQTAAVTPTATITQTSTIAPSPTIEPTATPDIDGIVLAYLKSAGRYYTQALETADQFFDTYIFEAFISFGLADRYAEYKDEFNDAPFPAGISPSLGRFRASAISTLSTCQRVINDIRYGPNQILDEDWEITDCYNVVDEVLEYLEKVMTTHNITKEELKE